MTTERDDLLQELNLIPDLESDEIADEEIGDEVPVVHYDITSYGIDFDVEGLIKRLKSIPLHTSPYDRHLIH